MTAIMVSKKHFLLLLILTTTLFFNVKGQQVEKTKFNLEKLNIVYLGIENPITIYDLNVGDTIIGDGFKILKGKTRAQYLLVPTKRKKITSLYVLNSKKDTISRFQLRVKGLPGPYVSFVGVRQGMIAEGKLKAGSQLTAQIESPFDVKIKITGFSLTIIDGQAGASATFKTKGNKLTGKMKVALKNVKRGDRVFFEDIKVRLSHGKTRKAPSIILKVK